MSDYFRWTADSVTGSFYSTRIGGSFAARSYAGAGKWQNAALDASEKTEGTASVKVTVPGTSGDVGHCGWVLQSDGSSGFGECDTVPKYDGAWLYVRWSMKFDASFDWGSGGGRSCKACRLKQSGVDAMTWHLTPTGFFFENDYYQATSGNSKEISYDFDPATNAAVRSWHEYIVGFKKQTASTQFDGEAHLYIDGVDTANFTGHRWWNVADGGTFNLVWGSCMVLPYWQLKDATSGGIYWVDDFLMSTDFQSDASAPPQGNIILTVS